MLKIRHHQRVINKSMYRRALISIQPCIVHRVRNSLKRVSWKDDKAITADLKLIDQASTELDARNQLAQLALTWNEKYP